MPRCDMTAFLVALAVAGSGTAAASAVAQEPCGGPLQPGCPPPAMTTTATTTTSPPAPPPSPPPPAKPAPAPPLSPERHAKLRRFFVAAAGRSQTRYVRACEALRTRGDPLLNDSWFACHSDLKALTASRRFGRCRSHDVCSSAVSRLRGALAQEISGIEGVNHEVRLGVRAAACRTALVTSEHETNALRRLTAIYDQFEQAYFSESPERYAAADRRLRRFRVGRVRSPKQRLAQFRRGCGSPA